MTNYDYNKIDSHLNDKFPYGTLEVSLVEKNKIKAIKASSSEVCDGKKAFKLSLTTHEEVYKVRFDTQVQLVDALMEVTLCDSLTPLVIAIANSPDGIFQRDYISSDYSLFSEAVSCL